MPRIRLPQWPGTGAAYLAWCAYPGEKVKRDRFWNHTMAGIAKATDTPLREIPKPLRGRRGEKIDNTVNRGLARIGDHRIPAAYEALRLVADEGWPDDPVTSMEAARKAMLALYARAKRSPLLLAGEVDHDNIRRLVERESRPAIALAVALLVAKVRHGFEPWDVVKDEAAAVFGEGILVPMTGEPVVIGP